MNERTREIQETQVEPAAGIWVCPNCGRRIQLISDSDVAMKQPFTCVCGTPMEPGEEHSPGPQLTRTDNDVRD
jgi:hypothetical protein